MRRYNPVLVTTAPIVTTTPLVTTQPLGKTPPSSQLRPRQNTPSTCKMRHHNHTSRHYHASHDNPTLVTTTTLVTATPVYVGWAKQPRLDYVRRYARHSQNQVDARKKKEAKDEKKLPLATVTMQNPVSAFPRVGWTPQRMRQRRLGP